MNMTRSSHEAREFSLAERIVKLINDREFRYVPRRGPPGELEKSWCQRFMGYRWGSSSDPFSDLDLIGSIQSSLEAGREELINSGRLSPASHTRVQAAVLELFRWGRVTRGKGHNPPNMRFVESVLKTAFYCSDRFEAPMDSAWTKLAAISTSSIKITHDQFPQVIFDSRVSVALLEAIDAVCELDSRHTELRDAYRKAGLGYVSGRGGNRLARVASLHKKGWISGYGKWSAQFVASRLVAKMVLVLNSTDHISRMPAPNDISQYWDTRGVEKVLFMDVY